MGNEKLTTLARRLRPFFTAQVSSLITGGAVSEGPDIDLVPTTAGVQVGRGGDTIILFDSAGAPLAEFAFTSAGFDLALAAATAGDVIQFPAGTLPGDHTIPADVTVLGFGWNTILSGAITNNGFLMFCNISGTLTNGDLGTALYMLDAIVAGVKVARTLILATEGYSAGSEIKAKGTGVTGTEGGAYLTAQGKYEAAVQLFCDDSAEYKQRYRWISVDDTLKAQLQDEYLDTTIRDLMVIDDLGNVTITGDLTINGSETISTDYLHNHVIGEDHTSECNGSNVVFETDINLIPESTQVFVNGIRQRLSVDYTEAISLDSVTLTTAPELGDTLTIDYLCTYEDGSTMARRVLISEQTPTGTGTVTWSGISAAYKSLEIEYVCRSTQAIVTSENMRIYCNNDTTLTNYRSARSYAYAAGTAGADGGADSNIDDPPAAGATAGCCTAGLIKIINYASTTFKKQMRCTASSRRDDATIFEFTISAGVEWESTAAITRVDLVLASGNYDTGSTFRLYGVY